MADTPYRRVHVVINPASGKNEPILNTLNDVFRAHDLAWDISLTHKYGDATEQAMAAVADGVDLVVGYGGDGTQHEIANAVLRSATVTGRQTPMGILPGGTGNGFAHEMGVPRTLREAAVLLCTSTNTRSIDVGRLVSVEQPQAHDRYFIQRLYVGIEPEEQTTRAMKDKYGVFAYAVNMASRAKSGSYFQYRADVDGEALEFGGTKIYVVNSGMMGTGLRITHAYAIDDGLLDCFVLDPRHRTTYTAAAGRFLNVGGAKAMRYYRQARAVTVAAEPDQPVWTDGEYVGRTPVTVDVMHRALTVVVP